MGIKKRLKSEYDKYVKKMIMNSLELGVMSFEEYKEIKANGKRI